MSGSASRSGGSGGSGAGSRGVGGAGVSGTSGGGGGSSGAGGSGSGSTSTACAACKYQRRKCTPDCPLSPYFPPDQPKRFQNVHKLFGVSNILRILKHVDPSKREDTVKSITYEADTREKDPVHGCLGVITILQNQVSKLKEELAVAREQLFLLQQQHNFNQQYDQQAQAQQIVSSLGGSTSIVNASSAQEADVLMPNFRSYNDMTEFAKSNPLSISSFEPDQYLRNEGFDQMKSGGAASTSRFDVGRYIRGESPGHHPGAVKHEQPPLPLPLPLSEFHHRYSEDHLHHHQQILQDVELPFDTAVDPFAMAIRRRGGGGGPSHGLLNLTVASEADLRRAAGGHHGVSEHELRSAGVYLTLTNN